MKHISHLCRIQLGWQTPQLAIQITPIKWGIGCSWGKRKYSVTLGPVTVVLCAYFVDTFKCNLTLNDNRNAHDRCSYMSAISGLEVRTYRDRTKGNHAFYSFHRGKINVATFWSYPNAKAFARGMAYGRNDNNPELYHE